MKRQLLTVILITLCAIVLAWLCFCRIVSGEQYPEARRALTRGFSQHSAGKLLAMACSADDEPDGTPEQSRTAAEHETVGLLNQPAPDRTEEQETESEMIDVQYDLFRGKLLRIKDPSRVFVGVSGAFGEAFAGKQVSAMAERYGAIAGINASGFEDANGAGNGGTPLGLVISEGKLLWGGLSYTYEVIGFDRENKLHCGYMTGQQALNLGIRDAVCFGPVLIRDGQPLNTPDNHGGLNPRSAIGQTADGTVLILAVEGRQISSIGATYNDIKQVLLDYGAVTAANLDGGASTVLYYEGRQQIVCSSLYGSRNIPTCWLVAPEQG